jgi:hypothetical protein
MSLQPRNEYKVPAETARVARAIFPNGHPYLQLNDTFGVLFEDEDFKALYPADGQQPGHLCGWVQALGKMDNSGP